MKSLITNKKKRALVYVSKKLRYHSKHWQKNTSFFFHPDLVDMRIPIDICRPVFTHMFCFFSYKQTSEEHHSLRYRAVLMWDPWFTVTLGRSLLWMADFRAKPYGHSLPLDIFPSSIQVVSDARSFFFKFVWLILIILCIEAGIILLKWVVSTVISVIINWHTKIRLDVFNTYCVKHLYKYISVCTVTYEYIFWLICHLELMKHTVNPDKFY